MKRILSYLIVLICFYSCKKNDYQTYYYYYDEKIKVRVLNSEYYICYDNQDIDSVIQSPIHEKEIIESGKNLSDSYSFALIKESLKEELQKHYVIPYITPKMRTENGGEFFVSNTFVVALRQESDTTLLKQLSDRYNLTITEYKFDTSYYLLHLYTTKDGNALDLANKFYETGNFEWCCPNIHSNIELCDN